MNQLFSITIFDDMMNHSLMDAIISIGIAFVLGLFIAFVYRKTFAGVMFSRTFGISLVALTMITSLVVHSVTSLAVSLSMLGAMSIIRFRTAVKDPLDIVYLFWSIGAGIVIGAGLIPMALIGSAAIGVILIVFSKKKYGGDAYILIIDCRTDAACRAAVSIVNKAVEKFSVKSKTVTGEYNELTLEVRLKNENTDFVTAISRMQGVEKAVLVSYNGNYME